MCMQNEKYLPLLSLPATKTFSCESHRDVDQNWARFLWGLCWILPCPQRTFQGELDFEFYGQVLFSTFWNWLWYQRLCRGSFYHRHLLSRPHDVVEISRRFVETYANFRNRNPWYEKGPTITITKVWGKKMRHIQKLAINEKSTIFVESSWNLVKMIISWGNRFPKVSWGLDKNCGFFQWPIFERKWNVFTQTL